MPQTSSLRCKFNKCILPGLASAAKAFNLTRAQLMSEVNRPTCTMFQSISASASLCHAICLQTDFGEHGIQACAKVVILEDRTPRNLVIRRLCDLEITFLTQKHINHERHIGRLPSSKLYPILARTGSNIWGSGKHHTAPSAKAGGCAMRVSQAPAQI